MMLICPFAWVQTKHALLQVEWVQIKSFALTDLAVITLHTPGMSPQGRHFRDERLPNVTAGQSTFHLLWR